MVVQESLLRKLRSAFDINIYEVKIWTSILSKGIATAGEIADISGVPRSRTYDVLESLEKKGFVIMKLEKPVKYIAVEPSEIVKRIKDNVKKNAEENIKMIEQIKTTGVFKELESLYKTNIDHKELTDLSASIKGRRNVYGRVDAMLKNVNKSVILVTSATGLIRKGKILNNYLPKLKQKGVRVKIAAPLTAQNKDVVNELKKYAEYKNVNTNSRFLIVDSKELLFMVSDDKTTHENYDDAVWVKTPYFAKTLENLFNYSWTSSVKVH